MRIKVNKKWHGENKMGRGSPIDQRIKWHIDHVKYCACRPVPNSLQKYFKK